MEKPNRHPELDAKNRNDTDYIKELGRMQIPKSLMECLKRFFVDRIDYKPMVHLRKTLFYSKA